MNKKQIAIIVTSILMVTSIVGFTVISSNNSNKSTNEKPLPTPKEEPVLSYEASSVDANINSLLGSGVIVGCSSEIILSNIDSKLLSVKSVKSIIKSSFLKESSLCSNLLYRATVSFDSNTDFSSLVKQIENLTSLKKVIVYRNAIVKLPEKITLKGTGLAADLNITKEFSFDQPFVEALADLETMKGDNVVVDLQMKLQGNKIISSNSVVIKNNSLFSLHELNLSTGLFSLDKKLVFSMNNAEFTGFKSSVLEEKVKSLNEVTDATIKVSNIGPLSVFFPLNDSNADDLKRKIEEKLSSFEEINSIKFFKLESTDKGKASIDWNSSYDLTNLKLKITSALKELNLNDSEIEFVNPVALIQGELILSTTDTKDLSDKIKKALFPSLVPVLNQTGKIAFTKLEDNNTLYYFNEPIPAVIFPGHATDDNISFNVRFYAKRNNVLTAQANEEGITG